MLELEREENERKRRVPSYDDIWEESPEKKLRAESNEREEGEVADESSSTSPKQSVNSNLQHSSRNRDIEKERDRERERQRERERREREHHSSSHKDSREKDRRNEHEDDRDRDRRPHKDRDSSMYRSRSSSSKDYHNHHSSSRHRNSRERSRERERSSRERSRDRPSSTSKSSSSNKHDSHDGPLNPLLPPPAPPTELMAPIEPVKVDENEYKQRVVSQLEEIGSQISEEEEIRRRRERRKAILDKYKQDSSANPSAIPPQQQDNNNNNTVTNNNNISVNNDKDDSNNNSNVPSSSTNDVPSNDGNSSSNDESKDDNIPFVSADSRNSDNLVVAAANFKEEAQEREEQEESTADKESGIQNGEQQQQQSNKKKRRKEPKDMFDSDSSDSDFTGQSPSAGLEPFKMNTIVAASDATDDAEGYYCYHMGEVLAGKYSVLGNYGKGMFATVLRARDLSDSSKEVAIKIVRNNDVMRKLGLKEIGILKDLGATDPENKYNIVRLLESFEDRGHLCLVFESMNGGNLREVLKKYGTKIGLNIKAVKLYAQKLMLALKLLKKCQIIHADIKPDNILVNETKTSIKLGDLGSAFPLSEVILTPLLVSRFYRAPEIILGLPYSYPIDMWSVGCSLYEIATGHILFPGKSNNEMLFMHQEVAGPVAKKLIKKGHFSNEHYDDSGVFRRILIDKLTKKEYIRPTTITKATRDLKEELLNSPFEITAEEKRMIVQLHDLLSQIFVIDPSQRISVDDALRHPFLSSIPTSSSSSSISIVVASTSALNSNQP